MVCKGLQRVKNRDSNMIVARTFLSTRIELTALDSCGNLHKAGGPLWDKCLVVCRPSELTLVPQKLFPLTALREPTQSERLQQ